MEKDEITPEYVINYAKRIGIENPKIEQIKSVFETMKKYKDNHWWDEKDSAIASFYQVFENTLILNLDNYREGLTRLLGRVIVWPAELFTNKEGIQKEALEAKTLYSLNISHSNEYAKEKLKEGIKSFEDYCKKTGKKMLKMDLNQDSPDDGRDENGIDNSGYDGWLK